MVRRSCGAPNMSVVAGFGNILLSPEQHYSLPFDRVWIMQEGVHPLSVHDLGTF